MIWFVVRGGGDNASGRDDAHAAHRDHSLEQVIGSDGTDCLLRK